uniref:Somatostatin/Cortistatin C-terminal domain-containing protein n=1 Tax=Hippocampus comes TaxID=109280 RepID=A0A3Q2XKD9_HIPCM
MFRCSLARSHGRAHENLVLKPFPLDFQQTRASKRSRGPAGKFDQPLQSLLQAPVKPPAPPTLPTTTTTTNTDLLARMAPAEGRSRRPTRLLPARVTAERSAEPPNNLPPRERKAGCKNFYWKGFTSC